MVNYLRILVSLSFVAGISILNPAVALSQDEGDVVINKASGEINSINKEKGIVVIKYLKDEEAGIYEKVTAYYYDATIAEKGNEAIEFSSLKVGSKVEIEYVTDDKGNNWATHIKIGIEEATDTAIR